MAWACPFRYFRLHMPQGNTGSKRMKQQMFMDLMDLAWSDFHAQDPQTAVGMITIIVHRDENDDMQIQMGSTVAPEIVEYALASLIQSWATGQSEFVRIGERPRRKVV